MVLGALERLGAGDRRLVHLGQAAGGRNQVAGGDRGAVRRVDDPAVAALVEAAPLHAGAELHVAAQVETVRDVIEVALELRLGGEPLGPVPIPLEFLGERVAVVPALDVAAGAGIAVPVPRPADAVALLEQPHREPQAAQPVQHVQPGRPRPDDDRVEVPAPVCAAAGGVRLLLRRQQSRLQLEPIPGRGNYRRTGGEPRDAQRLSHQPLLCQRRRWARRNEIRRTHRVLWDTRPAGSDLADLQMDTQSVPKPQQISSVTRHHEVGPRRSADNDRSIDDIRGTRDPAGRTCGPGSRFIEFLDLTARKQPRHPRLRPTAPTLRQDTRRDARRDLVRQRSAVQFPQTTTTAFGGDQRSRVIRDARHRSASNSSGQRLDDVVSPRQLLGREFAVLGLPLPHCRETGFDDERPLRRGIQPARQTHATACRRVRGGLRNVFAQRDRHLPLRHTIERSTQVTSIAIEFLDIYFRIDGL